MSYLSKLKSKERLVLEWAFQQPITNNKSKKKQKEKKYQLYDDDAKISSENLDDDDGPIHDSEFKRKHRNILSSNKSELTEKRILYQLLDFHLIELSKTRLKTMEKLDLQKNHFIKKQSKIIPILKKKNSNQNQKISKQSRELFRINNSLNDSDLDDVKMKGRKEKSDIAFNTRKISFREHDLKDSTQNTERFESNYLFNKKRSSTFSNLSASVVKRNSFAYSNNPYFYDDVKLPNIEKSDMIDKRFDDLINLVQPYYHLNEAKDIDKIIINNDAFKPSSNENKSHQHQNINYKLPLKINLKFKNNLIWQSS